MIKKKGSRLRSKIRIRKKIYGTKERPRMTIYRSLTNIYVQLIDDIEGKTLVSASSISKELTDEIKAVAGKSNKSKLVGALAAKKALENNIKEVVFDRNGYRYHGRVKSVADGAREGGLKF
jgi:large subunit ribosomal protein L18